MIPLFLFFLWYYLEINEYNILHIITFISSRAINEIYAFYKVNSKRTFLFINRNRVQILCIEAFGIIDSIEVIRLITPITLGGHIEKILKIIEYKRNLKMQNVL